MSINKEDVMPIDKEENEIEEALIVDGFTKQQLRQQIEADIEVFLKNNGKIQICKSEEKPHPRSPVGWGSSLSDQGIL